MRRPPRLAIEELEIERYLDQQLEAEKSGEFDNLYNAVLNEQESQKEDDESEDEDTTDEDEAKTVASIESLRALSLEDFNDARQFLLDVGDVIKTLASIGLHYGPRILSQAYKGVLYAISKLISGLFNGLLALQKHRQRLNESFDKSKANITALRQALELIETPADTAELTYSNQKVINSLKIGDQVDLVANLKVLNEFLMTTVKSISTGIDSDIGAIKQLIAYASSNTVKSPHDLMTQMPMTRLLESKVVEGFGEASELLTSYGYPHRLPGDVELIAQLPNSSIDNIDDIVKAYNKASLFLGFNAQEFRPVDTLPYLNKEQLVMLLNSLEHLCDSGLQHIEFYNQIERHKKSLRYNFRLYVSGLLESSKRVSVSESLIDYVSLKSMFIDRVYLPGAVDMHDYVIKVVSNGLKYAKENVTKLS